MIFLITVISCAGAYFLASQFLKEQDGHSLVVSGMIEAHEIRVGSKLGGRVQDVLVQEGAHVKAGDVLVRFDGTDLIPRLEQARAAIKQAEANLKKLRRGFRPEEIMQAKAAAGSAQAQLTLLQNGTRKEEIDIAVSDVASAQTEYDNALTTFHRVEKLRETNDASQQDYDTAKSKLDFSLSRKDAASKKLKLLKAGARPEQIQAAQENYEQANAQWKLMKKGNRSEDIEAAEALVEQAVANLHALEADARELEVKALTDAVVETVDVRPGDLVPPGSPVATLLESAQLYVRVFVPETKLGLVQLGKNVKIKVDSFPEKMFDGKIEQVAMQSEFTPRNVQTREERAHQVFMVKVKILTGADVLRAGMAADVIIGISPN